MNISLPRAGVPLGVEESQLQACKDNDDDTVIRILAASATLGGGAGEWLRECCRTRPWRAS
jgi:hypothetical protein